MSKMSLHWAIPEMRGTPPPQKKRRQAYFSKQFWNFQAQILILQKMGILKFTKNN